jgi:hypothetical protein
VSRTPNTGAPGFFSEDSSLSVSYSSDSYEPDSLCVHEAHLRAKTGHAQSNHGERSDTHRAQRTELQRKVNELSKTHHAAGTANAMRNNGD